MEKKSDITLSIVVPVKNEEDQIQPFLARLVTVLDALDFETEILFVNDGSSDETLPRLLAQMKTDPRIVILNLSRNFGKEAAVTAGMHYARGEAVFTMDVDLQSPPEMIPEFIKHWRDGAEIVFGQNIAFKPILSGLFYRLFNYIGDTKIMPHSGDFQLLDRKAVEAYRQLGEHSRYNKGLFTWLGFKQHYVPYEKTPTTRTPRFLFIRRIALATNAILSFSAMPVRIWTGFGLLIALASLSFAAFIAARTLVSGIDVPGWASLMVAILFTSGINMIGTGLLGEYIIRTFTESKKRPLYFISKIYRQDED